MKIVKLTAENFKRLVAVEITPDGNVIRITGKNGAGKSSVLDSIVAALGGGKEAPAMPIRAGEEKSVGIVIEDGHVKSKEGVSHVMDHQNDTVHSSPVADCEVA